MILIASIQVVCNVVILFIIDKAGRRPLLIFSGIVTSLSTLSMAFAFHLVNNGNTNFG